MGAAGCVGGGGEYCGGGEGASRVLVFRALQFADDVEPEEELDDSSEGAFDVDVGRGGVYFHLVY